MARTRRKAKQKSNVRDSQNLQLEGRPTTYKRKRNEANDSQQVNSKRRRSSRYNLRQSSSVVLVGETPCCQSLEQQEKYMRLGLNSALFLNSSQRPRRKQSHISVITISSDDEKTSEERTSEWVNNLDESLQCCGEPEPDHLSVNSEHHPQEDAACSTENVASTSVDLISRVSLSQDSVRPEQSFQPLCASTPCNTADLQSSPENLSEEMSVAQESNAFALTFIKFPTGYQPDKLNEVKVLDSFSNPPGLFSKTPSNTQFSSENLNPVVQLENVVPHFHFGTPTISTNVSITPTYPFHYYFNDRKETSKSDELKFSSTTDVNDSAVISEMNQGAFTNDTVEAKTNRSTGINTEAESDSHHSNPDEILSETNT